MLKTVVLLNVFVKTVIQFIRILRWIEMSSEQHLFEIEYFVTMLKSLLYILIN